MIRNTEIVSEDAFGADKLLPDANNGVALGDLIVLKPSRFSAICQLPRTDTGAGLVDWG